MSKPGSLVSVKKLESMTARLMIAGTHSGVGKTTLTAGLIAALDHTTDQESPETTPQPIVTSPTKVRFWGVRGSIPTPGLQTAAFGGNTSCVEVRVGEQILVLDAGSGIRALGQSLMKEFRGRPLGPTLDTGRVNKSVPALSCLRRAAFAR